MQLHELRAAFNQLSVVPVAVFLLKHLRHASFSTNCLTEMPWEMWMAPSLEKLLLANNGIKQLPGLPSQERVRCVLLLRLCIVNVLGTWCLVVCCDKVV